MIRHNNTTNTKHTEKHRRIGGIVQEKLDQINRKRELDHEHFMKEMAQGNAIVTSNGITYSADIKKKSFRLKKESLVKSK